MKNKIIILLIIVSAVILRLYNLGKVPFWEDELFTLHRSNMPVGELLKELSSRPIFPPLYYLLTKASIKIFGINEAALRFPSFIFSVLSVFFIYKLAELIYNARTGLFAALLLAVSPYSIYYAQEAKMYSASWALSIISFWLFFRLIRRVRVGDCILYICVNALSWYMSYVGIVYTLIQGASFLIFRDKRFFKKWLWMNFLVVIMFTPWLDKLIAQVYNHHGMLWIPKTTDYFNGIKHIFYVICTIKLLPFKSIQSWAVIGIYICAWLLFHSPVLEKKAVSG